MTKGTISTIKKILFGCALYAVCVGTASFVYYVTDLTQFKYLGLKTALYSILAAGAILMGFCIALTLLFKGLKFLFESCWKKTLEKKEEYQYIGSIPLSPNIPAEKLQTMPHFAQGVRLATEADFQSIDRGGIEGPASSANHVFK